jgi:hypothetical protein
MRDQKLYQRITKRIEVDPSSGCWNWTGPYHKTRKYPGNRYGYLSTKEEATGKWKSTCVHRAMWFAVHGTPDAGICVLHRCDNVKCCNPDHLWIGTRRDNTMDMVSKKRHHLNRLTECKRGHPLSGDNLYVQPGSGYRVCKECTRQRMRNKWRSDPAYRARMMERRRLRYSVHSANEKP